MIIDHLAELTEPSGKPKLVLCLEMLIPKQQDAVSVPSLENDPKLRIVERRAQIQPDDFGADRRREGDRG